MAASHELAPGIVRLEAFVTPGECAEMMQQAARHVHWVKAHVGQYQDDQLIARRVDLEARDVEVGELPSPPDKYIVAFPARVSAAIAETMGVNALLVEDFMLSRYVPGCHIKAHSDTGVYSTSRVVTAVLYLNDDYRGGEIFFPQFGIQARPGVGDVLLFWSEYEHGVAAITDGMRMSLVSFGKAPAMLRLESTN